MNETILDAIRSRIVVADGAMGTQLQKLGLEPGGCPELWNLEQREKVLSVHRAYVEAGAEAILTNSFGASPIRLRRRGFENRLDAFNRAAVELARESGAKFVLGDVGPCGELLEPYGTVTRQEAAESFGAQVRVLIAAGADAILIETMTSLEEALIALESAKAAGAAALVSMSFEKGARGFRTLMGEPPEKCAEALQQAGADMVGTNCGSAADMTQAALILHEFRKGTHLPLFAKPNGGLPQSQPDGSVRWLPPEDWIAGLSKLRKAEARIIGGCCGTGPEHVMLLRSKIGR